MLRENEAFSAVFLNGQLADRIKSLLEHPDLQSISLPLLNRIARLQGHGVRRIFLDEGIWIHETPHGYFAYHQPYLRLDLLRLDECARRNYFWRYTPNPGDVIMDVGAGVGEETLTFSRAVGGGGRVICVEAHPRTYRCLEKLVHYNRLGNVVIIHAAATEPGSSAVRIEDEREYLRNRVVSKRGTLVPTTTIDAIFESLRLRRVQFLKMNIEGSEGLAIRGMTTTLKHTEIFCVSCHDFLAARTDGEDLRTKAVVKEFFKQNGLELMERREVPASPFLCDQVWAYNPKLTQKIAAGA